MLWEDPDLGRPAEPTWSVGELGDALDHLLRRWLPEEIWVRGEIHDLARARSGHVYFTLVEDRPDGSRASLAVMLAARQKAGVNRTLTEAGGAVRMTDGTDVRVRGRVDWFAPRGQLQLRMTAIDPAYTLGRLALERAALLARLDAEGLLGANAARPMPALPLTVGLVTSRGSAAEADVLAELHRSGIDFDVVVVDARVQGPTAAASLVAAVETLGRRRVDVVVVARGGGARTDLAAFDDEAVARAIAACPHPVVVGVGHETDRSVADEVAHTSAKTPTAAAAAVVAVVRDRIDGVEQRWRAVTVAARARLAAHDERARRSAVALAATTRRRLDAGGAGLALRAERLARRPAARLDALDERAVRAQGRLVGATRRSLTGAQARGDRAAARLGHRAPRAVAAVGRDLRAHEARLAAMHPGRALARGWSITRDGAGRVVRDPSTLAPGDALTTTVAGGVVHSVVAPADPPPPRPGRGAVPGPHTEAHDA